MDQDLDCGPGAVQFEHLEPPFSDDDYMFTLSQTEGISDLFDIDTCDINLWWTLALKVCSQPHQPGTNNNNYRKGKLIVNNREIDWVAEWVPQSDSDQWWFHMNTCIISLRRYIPSALRICSQWSRASRLCCKVGSIKWRQHEEDFTFNIYCTIPINLLNERCWMISVRDSMSRVKHVV